MSLYVPRVYQPPMTRFVIDHERCNIFARMGAGKTPAMLEAVAYLYAFNEVKRVLVIAPKRVAQSTWIDELAQFKESFGHMTIAAAVGTPKQRLDAVKKNPDILCINYESMEWLIDGYGDRWPFDMVIADESGMLKGHRVGMRVSSKGNTFAAGQGSVRAAALARIAHKYIRRFVNLNGSPAPNGLQDLWAGMWFIDGGKRLGTSFSGFQDRYFVHYTSDSGYSKLRPLPYAKVEIEDAIRDVSLTVDPRPFLNARTLVEHHVKVRLPPRARKAYDEMQDLLFTEIAAGKWVEAFNNGGKVNKCLGAGTEVLTQRGWIAIELCTSKDLVWDGDSWVGTDGPIDNGVRNVVKCWDAWLTPDHKVLTNSGWKTALEVLCAKSHCGFERKSVRLPDDWRKSGNNALAQRWSEISNLARPLRMWKKHHCNWAELNKSKQKFGKVVRVQTIRAVDSISRIARAKSSPIVQNLVGNDPKMHKPILKRLGELRSARNNSLQSMAVIVSEVLRRYVSNLEAGAVFGKIKQLKRVLCKELQMGHTHRASKQSKGECLHKDSERYDDYCQCGKSFQSDSCNHSAENKKRLDRKCCFATSAKKTQVYDLTNCGPNSRFTVRGSDGTPFISHNCLQIASVFAIHDSETRAWEHVHDEKVEALKSIVSEMNGESVLVRYNFVPEREMIMKAFPHFKVLDSDPQTIRDFQDGLIPGLVTHAKSAGHGLSLQKNCRTLIDFSRNFNLGEDEQIIERVGPTRQAQSGFDRDSLRYSIVAEDTLDLTSVIPVLQGKMSVQDSLLAAMQR